MIKKFCFKENAFSLIEILVTVILVGVVASIGLINMGRVIEKSKTKEAEQMLYDQVAEQKRTILETNVGYIDSSFLTRVETSTNYAYAGGSTGNDTLSSFSAVWARGGSDNVWVWNVEHTIGGANPAKYALYIQHGGPAGNNLTIKCSESASFPGICTKLGYPM